MDHKYDGIPFLNSLHYPVNEESMRRLHFHGVIDAYREKLASQRTQEQRLMQRRHHSKSREGCINCKRRRVKCDEQKPHCRKCVARETTCKYGLQDRLIWINKDSLPESPLRRDGPLAIGPDSSQSVRAANPESARRSATSALDTGEAHLCAGLDCKGIELIINWVSSTVYTINPDDDAVLRVSQTVILKEASSHQFLLNGILALSALHLADQKGENGQGTYSRLAIGHHNEGLSMFRMELQNINSSNHSAIIAFSSVSMIFSMALSRPLQGNSISPLDDIAQIFQLVKGWHEIVRVAVDLDLAGPTNVESPSKLRLDMTPSVSDAFRHLHELNNMATLQDGNHEAKSYAEAINSLFDIYGKLAHGNLNPHMAGEWANILPSRFLGLLKERSTLALLIMGHYCVVLNRFKHLWWLQGWSSGLLKVIWHKVDAKNRAFLVWPMEIVGLGAMDL